MAAAGKLRSRTAFEEFVGSVASFSGLRPVLVRPLAFALAAAEPAAAVLVLVPRTALAGLIGTALLLAAFTVAVARAVLRKDRTPCHCFGKDTEPVSWRHVARNLVLLGAAVLDAVLVAGRSSGRAEPAGIALCLLAAGVAVAGVALLDDIAALLGPPPERLR
jgi:hypothetical protein